MTTILIKKKDTAGAPAPGDLTNSAGGTEIAVNTATKRIYTKDSGGNVVELGTNATSSTVVDLTVTTSATLSYGTANQVQYLNGSKVLTGSANLTFNGTLLTAAALTSTGVATFSAGTVSDPAITTTGDTNTGMYFPAADTIAFTEGGVEAMRITSTGAVGIGNTNPTAQLDVNSRIRASGSSTPTLELNSTASGSWKSELLFLNSGTGKWAFGVDLLAGGVNTLYWYDSVNAATRMALTTTGSLGIGLLAPTKKLDVYNSGTATTDSTVRNDTVALLDFVDSGAAYNIVTTNHPFIFGTNNTERMRITNVGSVGIGTSTPATALFVYRTATDSVGTFQGLQTESGGTGRGAIQLDVNGKGGFSLVCDATSGTRAFTINNNSGYGSSTVEAMRIDNNGNVGIGVTSPVGKLDIISGTARMYFSNQSATAFITAVDTGNTAYAPMAINGSVMILKTGDSERLRIDSSGRVGIGTNSPNANGVLTVSQSTTGTSSDGIRLVQTNTGQSGLYLQRTGGTASDWLMYQPEGSTQLRFFGGAADRVIFATNGNVGINTTPTTPLTAYTAANALATLMFSGNNGRMLGKFSANGGVAGKTFNLLTVDTWYSVNSRIFVNVKVMWVDPISDQGNTAIAWAGASQGGTRTQGSFTTTLVWTNSGVGSLSWSGNTLRLTTPSAAIFACCSIDVEFVAFDGAAVTFDVSNQ